MKKTLYLETERLLFYKPDDDDYDFLYQILKNPTLMKFICQNVTDEIAKSVIQRTRKHWEDNSFGSCVIIFKDNEKRIGFGGPKYYPPLGEDRIDMGFILIEEYQNKGLAYEGMKELIKHSFEFHKFQKLSATTTRKNLPTVHLMKKFGFVEIQSIQYNFDGINFDNSVLMELTAKKYSQNQQNLDG